MKQEYIKIRFQLRFSRQSHIGQHRSHRKCSDNSRKRTFENNHKSSKLCMGPTRQWENAD